MKAFETQGPLEMQRRDTMSCLIIGGIQHLGQKQSPREPHDSELPYSCGPRTPFTSHN